MFNRRNNRDRSIKLYNYFAGVRTLVYDTIANGSWTLTGYSLSAPERKTNYVSIPGRDGEIDLASNLTDGYPRYKNRTFTATLESSNGSRADREELISDLVNTVEGRYLAIIAPDDEAHYMIGYVHTEVEFSDINHCRVILSANVAPWREALDEVYIELTPTNTTQYIYLENRGGRPVAPTFSAWGTGSVTLTWGSSESLTIGSDEEVTLTDLMMRYKDKLRIEYTGNAQHAACKYREANL